MEYLKKNKKIIGLVFAFLILVASLFDKVLASGLFLAAFLGVSAFLVFYKAGLRGRIPYLVFALAFLVHILAVIFIFYTGFQPFSGGRGDYTTYNLTAIEVSERLSLGNFSLEGISYSHYYPIIIGYLYFLALPSMLMGQLLNAWIAALGVFFAYLLVKEIGGNSRQAFWTAMAVNIYPSFLFYSSLMLKDPLVIALSLAGLLLMVKVLKSFSLKTFLAFYFVLGFLIHFRVYIGLALLLAFIVCWFFLANLKIKKRLVYGGVIVVLLGFLPQFATAQGYYGIKFLKSYLNPEKIKYYREVVYAPPEEKAPVVEVTAKVEEAPIPDALPLEPKIVEPAKPVEPAEPVQLAQPKEVENSFSAPGQQSSVTVEAGFESPFVFIKNYLISFTYSLLGPFVWQMKHLRHFLVLPELLGWYFLFFLATKGVKENLKKYYRAALPLAVFGIIALGALSLFINNFGIITRIRMPVFIAFACLSFMGAGFLSKYRFSRFFSNSLEFLLKI